MCPDPQFLSIYMDGELPSPWKEKMEAHLSKCSVCKEKFENFTRLQELFKKDTRQVRTIADREAANTERHSEEKPVESIEEAKNRVWHNMEVRLHSRAGRLPFNSSGQFHTGLWRKRLSIPMPAAAAAAVVLTVLAALWYRGGFNPMSPETAAKTSIILAVEEELPAIIPAADMNSVIQYLGAEKANIILLELPPGRNFSRTGDPAIINAANYNSRRFH
jgi:anti-sigma factor RsiW